MTPFLRPFFIWNKFLCFHLFAYFFKRKIQVKLPELTLKAYGSFHVKSTQKMDDPVHTICPMAQDTKTVQTICADCHPSGFSSNLVRPMHIQSNLATPNFYPIREVFLELWSV